MTPKIINGAGIGSTVVNSGSNQSGRVMSQRLASLRGLAHTIARRFQSVRENGNATPEVLAHHFDLLTKHSGHMRGGSVSTAEMEILALELVPEAIKFLADRMEIAA